MDHMDRIDIETATADQLRTFGSQILGLDLNGRENRRAMIGKMTEIGYALSFITLSPPAPVPSGGPRSDTAFNTRKTDNGVTEVRIVLHTKDEKGGDRPVQVGVNGKLMLIPRGEPHWVPEAYVEVLNHAEENIYAEYDSEEDGLGGLKKPRVVKAYPFSYA